MKSEDFEPEMHPDLYEPQFFFDSSDDGLLAPLTDFVEADQRGAHSSSSDGEPTRVTFQTLSYKKDVEEFGIADSEEKMTAWIKRLSFTTESFFGEEFLDSRAFEEYKADEPRSLLSLRKHMELAMQLRRLVCLSEITLEEMKRLNIKVTEKEQTPEGNSYCSASLPIRVQGKAFGDYAQEGVTIFSRHRHELVDAKLEKRRGACTLVLSDEFGFIDTVKGMQGCCAHLLDALSEIHLHSVSTITNKGIPKQRFNCFAADLWYRMSEHFRLGNVVLCAYDGCRKPLIAYENQGLPKKYCGDRCRDRARRQRQREKK